MNNGEAKHKGNSHGHDHSLPVGDLGSTIIFFLALDIHSVIAGLGISAQTDTSNFLAYLVVIVVHKAFAGFALGTSFAAAVDKLSVPVCVVLSVIFSLSTPTGIYSING